MIIAPRHESSASIPTRKGWKNKYVLLILLFLISIIVSVVLFVATDEPALSADSDSGNEPFVTRSGSKPKPAPEIKQDRISDQIVPIDPATSTATPGVSTTASAVGGQLAGGSESGLTVYPATSRDLISYIMPVRAVSVENSSQFFEVLPFRKPTDPIPVHMKQPLILPSYFTLGVYDSPEWIFNDLQDSRFINYFGMEGAWHRGPFSLGTGAGFSMLQGKVESTVKYRDDISDSIPVTDTANVLNRYTYLQIPVILGYDFWEKGILTVGVRFGGIMSVLLDTKQLSEDIEISDKQVEESNRITPQEVGLNWQLAAGINLSTELTKGIWFEITPMAKYYSRSFYEKSGSVKKPWSAGLRTALMFKL